MAADSEDLGELQISDFETSSYPLPLHVTSI